jgi:hypothetical protein
MKKLLVLSLVSVSLFSCKEKLPSNIESAVNRNNWYVEELNQVDSIIIGLKDSDIKSISPDSARSLYVKHNIRYESYNSSSDELEELLKYNANYSNHDDVKNRKYHFVIENRLPWEDGQGIIQTNLDNLLKRSME